MTLRDHQFARLRALLAEVWPANPFVARKLADAGLTPADLRTPADLARLPFTTKAELLADQAAHPPYGTNLTYPLAAYSRLHQTSGTTTGRPLRWLDTPASWAAMLGTWDAILEVVGVGPGDVLFFPFSFGPFLGFWTAFDAASRAGRLCLPGGGMSSSARLRFLVENRATVVFCTPTYAVRLAEVAAAEGVDLAGSAVRALVVAGEPGGNVPATRARIEAAWGARVFDHHGLTETGPASVECPEGPGGLHLIERDFLPEVVDPATGAPVPAGEPGELVLTTLGRTGSPLIRYRTGDRVVVDPRPCPCGRAWMRLDGGIRGRWDDMIQVRGNNLHPDAIEAVVLGFADVAEYRLIVDRTAALAAVRLELEPRPGLSESDAAALAGRVEQAVRDRLLFRVEPAVVPPNTLPRSEMKSRRVVFRD